MKTICIDFDGVIHDNLNYKGSSIINGNLVPGAKESLEDLSNSYEIVIHSARCQDVEAMNNIREWLQSHDMNYDVVRFKPHAHIFLDDRGISFNGDWSKAIEEIKNFTQWQQGDKDKIKRLRALNKRNIPIIMS